MLRDAGAVQGAALNGSAETLEVRPVQSGGGGEEADKMNCSERKTFSKKIVIKNDKGTEKVHMKYGVSNLRVSKIILHTSSA